MQPVIRVENLSKQYRLGTRDYSYTTVRETIVSAARATFRPFRRAHNGNNPTIWALKDVSFTVAPSEVIGIIGRNGAGKSTLLKILSRVAEPTTGRIELYGRVGSLLEVGTGFHPELTGRENIYLNGSILGMTRQEVSSKFDEIVDFAELETFLDTPVKRFSSGMYLRLAFAVAAHLDPEILMVDEVLAVGDMAFQDRCLGKMQDVARSGRTVLLVSHNMGAIQRLCQRVIYLKNGRLELDGSTDKVINEYIGSVRLTSKPVVDLSEDPNAGGEEARITAVRVLTAGGLPAPVIASDQPFVIEVEHEWFKSVPQGRITIDISDSKHQVIFVTRDDDGSALYGSPRHPGRYTALCTVPGFLLNAGEYNVSVHLSNPGVKWVVQISYVASFTIDATAGLGAEDGGRRPGVVLPLLKWDLAPR